MISAEQSAGNCPCWFGREARSLPNEQKGKTTPAARQVYEIRAQRGEPGTRVPATAAATAPQRAVRPRHAPDRAYELPGRTVARGVLRRPVPRPAQRGRKEGVPCEHPVRAQELPRKIRIGPNPDLPCDRILCTGA